MESGSRILRAGAHRAVPQSVMRMHPKGRAFAIRIPPFFVCENQQVGTLRQRSLVQGTMVFYNKNMRERYGEIAKYILVALGVAGVVVLIATAPGALAVAKLFPRDRGQFPKKFAPKSMARSVQGLQKNKFLVIRERNGKVEVRLTKKGRQKFKEIQLEKLEIPKPTHWDRKWRIVIFDIPDKSLKQVRDVLREKLKKWNFYPLQKSVWVCPWPCEHEMQLVVELYGIASYVNIIVAEKIVGDALVRKHFGMP